jgi:hypothetical protein
MMRDHGFLVRCDNAHVDAAVGCADAVRTGRVGGFIEAKPKPA